jgi:hypothetical protein
VCGLFLHPLSLAAAEIAGFWATSEGELSLTQQGNQITGSYPLDHGEVTGNLNGYLLEGYWIEDSSAERCSSPKNGRYNWGKIHFQFEGNKFSGAWGYCDKEPAQRWTGSKRKDCTNKKEDSGPSVSQGESVRLQVQRVSVFIFPL